MMEATCGQLLFILYIILVNALADDFRCRHPLPGLSHVLKGYDIIKLDLLPPNLGDEDGSSSPVLEFTCKLGKKKTIKEKTFDLPDQIWNIRLYSRELYVNSATLYKTSFDSLKQIAARMDVNVFDGAFMGSANYLHYQNVIRQNSMYVEEINATKLLYKLQLKPSENLVLDTYFENAIASLPTNFTAGIEAYQNVINEFGTHYFNKAAFGGIVMMRLETSQKYCTEHTDKEIIGEASSNFRDFLQKNGMVLSKAATVSKEFKDATTESTRSYGGNGIISLQKWQDELIDFPWILYGTVTPIWDLIANDTIQENMMLAVKFRKDRVHLEDLKRTLHQQYNYLLPEFQSKIDELLSASFFDHSSFEKINHDIKNAIAEDSTTPTWFQKMNFCYSWICTKPVSSERCITPSMDITEDYHKPEVNCSFRWKLSLESPPKWLENYQMCTNWCPNTQCHGSDSICFRIGDVTDKCKINVCQPHVKTPSNVPSWAKKSFVCFNLDPDFIGETIHCEWVNKYNSFQQTTSGGWRLNSSLVVLVITLISMLSVWLLKNSN